MRQRLTLRSLKIFPEWLRRLLVTPTAELSRWQYATRFFLEVCRHGAKQLREDRAGQMAAALAFQTILGLVPVTIIAIVIFRGLGGFESFQAGIENMLNASELHAVRVPTGDNEEITLAQWLTDVIQSVNEGISGKTIGVIGSLVLAWAAIGLLTTVERCFNIICGAPEHRPLQRRIPLYFTAITLGPILVYASFYLTARLRTIDIDMGGWATEWIASSITSFGMTWIFLLGLYSLMPNSRVNVGAASLGAFVAAILWTLEKHLFGAYITLSFGRGGTFSILYGALGLIPVFLLWVYLLWLVVLFGMELTRILQVVGMRMDQHIPDRPQLPPVVDPASVVPVMQVIADRFREGKTAGVTSISEGSNVNERVIELMLAELLAAGMVHQVDGEGLRYTLARPPDQIAAADLIRIGLKLAGGEPDMERGPVWRWVARLRAAQLEAAAGKTLADL